jgi:hypothetical protein
MEDVNAPLALPAPHAQEVAIISPTMAIQPTHDSEPTLQTVSTPHHDLTALLADIPSTVHIENLAFSVSQHMVVNEGVDVASL